MDSEQQRLNWWTTQEDVRRISEGVAFHPTDFNQYQSDTAETVPANPNPVDP